MCLRTGCVGKRVSKRDEETGGWKKLHNEELHNLYSSPNIIRVTKLRSMRWAGNVVRTGAVRNTYKILVGKPEGKRPLGKPRLTWEDNIKMGFLEIWLEGGLGSSGPGPGPVAGSCEHVMNLLVP
jgi:hypothetical protein